MPEDDDLRVEPYTGAREALRSLFAEAEDSAERLDAYLHAGRVLVAVRDEDVLGHLQLVDAGHGGLEIMNMAVRADLRGRGIGGRLVQAAVALAAAESAPVLVVSTAAADVGNLRFYQRQGFRMRSVERDAFTERTGYPTGIVIDGVPLRDRVWLDRVLGPQDAGPSGPSWRAWAAARIARPVHDLARSTRFYRDLLGLPVRGGFRDHDGYDGTFFDLPGGGELELTAGPATPAPGTDEDLLVLYAGTPDAAAAISARVGEAGTARVASPNPYWNRWGTTFLDPDGYRVVVAVRDRA